MRASSLLKAAVIGGLCFVGSLAQDGNMPTHIPLQLNKNLELELATDADATYFLETSSDLENWSFAGSYKVGDGALHRQLIDPDGEEFFYKYFTAPTNFAKPDDTDGDGIPNTWELNNDLNPTDEDEDANGQNDGLDDSDSDGLSNQAESLIGTSLSEPDSDGNGISDYDEDADGDGVSNGEDGWPLCDILAPPRLAPPNYVAVPFLLPANTTDLRPLAPHYGRYRRSLNNNGRVLLEGLVSECILRRSSRLQSRPKSISSRA